MFASVMHYLMDTLVLASVGHELATKRGHKDRERAIMESSADDLRPYIEYVPPGEPRRAFAAGLVYTRKAYDAGELPPIWDFATDSNPACVGVGAVRVKEMRLAKHVAFESIDWGTLLDSKRLASEAHVLADGKWFTLPLQTRFLYAQWWLKKPVLLPTGAMNLFPLFNPVNCGIVRAFLFHRVPGGDVTPLDPKRLTQQERDEWEHTAEAMRKLEYGSIEQDPFLGLKLFEHQALVDRAPTSLGGTVGEDEAVRVRALGNRFLVTISMSVSRDVYDFEPSGALDSARVYPHAHFVSTTSCNKVEIACHIKRPKRTRIVDPEDSEPMHDHDLCQDMHTEVRNLFVVDTNDDNVLVHNVPVDANIDPRKGKPIGNFNPAPQWGNLFSYYLPDASDKLPDRTYKMVHEPSRPVSAPKYGVITREEPHLVVPLLRRDEYHQRRLRISKVSRQGEFDNIHMAPRMMLRATHARFKSLPFEKPWVPIDPQEFHLDEVVMAPLCAHDCFHSHWRWGDALTTKQVFGWGPTAPHQIAGAAMIPPWHRLEVLLPSRNEIIFSETALKVAPGKQEVFFHFGAAYGLAADGLRSDLNKVVSGRAGASKGAPWEFGLQNAAGKVERVDEESWPVMYWNFRYYMEEGTTPLRPLIVREYTIVHSIIAAMEM